MASYDHVDIKIVEVSPRDGLQNVASLVSAKRKIQFVNQLSGTGLGFIEVTSFVSPKAVPQLSDSDIVFSGITKRDGVEYSALVPNEQGLERALRLNVQHIAIFTAASEQFCQKNIRCSIEESLCRFKPVIDRAKAEGCTVRAYVSCVLGCPYEGKIKLQAVTELVRKLNELGCDEISLGDTIGVGTAKQSAGLVRACSEIAPISNIAVHFHDTRGQALANILSCIDQGVRIIDASVAGLGGCPYAKNASGNVATEDVIYMLHGMGLNTGVDLEALIKAGQFISQELAIENHSRVAQAGVF
ncbi:Hydroxymethylglutaryl-CoA lyase [hydrothermal vent metagenome]|uniref:hydroxymethylglutaryl-CoA lyase n=1 Tax=hydrothermal vent metagenome TaxID=652676 RepID=A0A3B0Z6T6_9ZZZZ